MIKKADITLITILILLFAFSFSSLEECNAAFRALTLSKKPNKGSSCCPAPFSNVCCQSNEKCIIDDPCKDQGPECTATLGTKCVALADDCMCAPGERFDTQNCIPEGEGTICITLFDPVCGCDGMTYSNSCVAGSKGIKKFTKGECNQTLKKNWTGIWRGKVSKLESELNISSSSSGSLSSSGNVPFCSGSKVLCPDGFHAVCSNTAYTPKCLTGGFPDCCKKTGRAFDCKAGFLSCVEESGLGLSSSGDCIICTQVIPDCSPGQKIVGQTCNECAHCEDVLSKIVQLQFCIKDGKLEGVVHQIGVIDNAMIISQEVISENEVIVTLEDKNGRKDLLTLKLLSDRRIIGIFENGISFQAVKTSKRCFSAIILKKRK